MLWLRLWGMKIGRKTRLPVDLAVNWPHQIAVGEGCTFESYVSFKYDGPWRPGPSIRIGNGVFVGRGVEFNITSGLSIGDQSAIAAGCKFIDHDHLTDEAGGVLPGEGPTGPITLGSGVWLGAGVIVLKGVEIGDRAVIGAGSIVTRSVPAGEKWMGVPARSPDNPRKSSKHMTEQERNNSC
jgi:acetyltransferase-like isoleucine patch superfamily enzyme